MVQIITDTTASLSPEFAHQYQIPVIPQYVNFGEESFAEGVDIDIPTFLQRLQASKQLPKTAAPPPELFSAEFERLVPKGETILCIHPSAEVSGTVRSATLAAQDFPQADIRVIDTRLIASPLGSLVQLAAQWAQQGLSADEIETRIKRMAAGCSIYFLVATLEYLEKGGRIGGAAALLGSVLQVKPILTLQDGRVEPYEKERTMRRALQRIHALVDQQAPHSEQAYPSVIHGAAPEQAQELADTVAGILGISQVPVLPMPPAVVTHAGPGVLGVGFFTKSF